MTPFDLSAGPFLALYITALALGVGAGVLVRRYDPRPPAAPMGDSLDPIALAYLAGGRARALDAAMIGLLEAGAVTFDSLKKAVSPAEPAPWVVPCLAPFQRALDTTSSLAALTQRLDAPLAAVRATLVARGLAFDKAGSAAARPGAVCSAAAHFAIFVALKHIGLLTHHDVSLTAYDDKGRSSDIQGCDRLAASVAFDREAGPSRADGVRARKAIMEALAWSGIEVRRVTIQRHGDS